MMRSICISLASANAVAFMSLSFALGQLVQEVSAARKAQDPRTHVDFSDVDKPEWATSLSQDDAI